ncbi:MAG: cysteine desulfurase [Bacilli bacterium]|nr:cysteine desulfurase [Bacilli bacterium]
MSGFDVNKIRQDFPMLSNGIKMQGHPLVWLDNASTTLKPQCVLDAVSSYYTHRTSNSHRGDYDLCAEMDREVEKTREIAAKLIGAEPREIVFTSGDTDSLNLVAECFAKEVLKEGDEILLTEAEHASNVLPWYRLQKECGALIRFIPLSKGGRVTIDNVRASISNKTKIIALAEVTNVLGYLLPTKEIAALAHEVGAYFVVDGAQSVPHKRIDVKELDIDFLAFSGHKMCGPTGIGFLYGKYDLLKRMDPYRLGGGMNVKFDVCGTASFLEPPARFEAGTQNLEGILGLKAAIEYVSSVGFENIEKREKELKQYAVNALKKTGAVTIYNEDSEAGIVTFNVDGVFAQDAATYFNSKGIAVRSGQHCAKILNDFLSTVATIRASFYFYTTEEEIDALVEAVKTCKGEYLNAYFI